MEIYVLTKNNGLFDVRPLVNYLNSVSDGTYKIEVKRVRKNRSLDQNGWLFGCIYPLLLNALVAEGWEFVNVTQVHEFFKDTLCRQKLVNRHTGEIVEIPQSTAEMDTVQFSAYCEKLREYGREFLGIEIPDPTPMWNK